MSKGAFVVGVALLLASVALTASALLICVWHLVTPVAWHFDGTTQTNWTLLAAVSLFVCLGQAHLLRSLAER